MWITFRVSVNLIQNFFKFQFFFFFGEQFKLLAFGFSHWFHWGSLLQLDIMIYLISNAVRYCLYETLKATKPFRFLWQGGTMSWTQIHDTWKKGTNDWPPSWSFAHGKSLRRRKPQGGKSFTRTLLFQETKLPQESTKDNSWDKTNQLRSKGNTGYIHTWGNRQQVKTYRKERAKHLTQVESRISKYKRKALDIKHNTKHNLI